VSLRSVSSSNMLRFFSHLTPAELPQYVAQQAIDAKEIVMETQVRKVKEISTARPVGRPKHGATTHWSGHHSKVSRKFFWQRLPQGSDITCNCCFPCWGTVQTCCWSFCSCSNDYYYMSWGLFGTNAGWIKLSVLIRDIIPCMGCFELHCLQSSLQVVAYYEYSPSWMVSIAVMVAG
jgi:hypothetical protein